MRTRTIAIVAAAAAVAGVAGAALAPLLRGPDAFAECRGGVASGGDLGGPFTLVDGKGQTVTDAEVFTEPSLVYFGFTSCPDVCPLDMARNAQATGILESRGIAARPVFVSVDPERDSPEVVEGYAASFAPDAVGLTGTPDQVAAAARAYRVYYAKQDGDADYYLVDHSTYSYMVLPGRGVVDVVARDEGPEAVADRLACFVAAAA